MRYLKSLLSNFVTCSVIVVFLAGAIIAGELPHPDTYMPSLEVIEKHKKPLDDPRPVLETLGPKQVLPPELYQKLTFDVDAMKTLWAEIVGFKSSDIVGKIAPEIKPGKYTYKDLDKYPGLKELMWPDLYNRIKPGGPPHAGNIPEFEVVPTRQLYWALPIADATKKNMGKTQLDESGYLKWETWEGGIPFPRPLGEFKAQQLMYNVEKRYVNYENHYGSINWFLGWDKNLRVDFDGVYFVQQMLFSGRTLMPPYGCYDERAKERGEYKAFLFGYIKPRDVAGLIESALFFLDPSAADQIMLYIPAYRRVRKLSATDTQDPVGGQDLCYDDLDGFNQKLSPSRYPWEYKVIGEREYLCPAPTRDGSEYISSQGYEFRNMKFERRPFYVVQLTQKDPNYVYNQRIFYIDKETFYFVHQEMFDQKGRLYRTWDLHWAFFPEMGAFSWTGALSLFRDHVDTHSSTSISYGYPAFYNRGNVSLEGIMKKGK